MNNNVLVAYFSASGTTRTVAEILSDEIGADLYEIKPEEPYTDGDLNWNNPQSRSSREMNNPEFRPLLEDKDPDVSDYDVVLMGFPVWWYVAPTIINSFLESADFAGKAVIPFATSGGSGIGKCVDALKKQYPDIAWGKGHLLNSKKAIDELIESMK